MRRAKPFPVVVTLVILGLGSRAYGGAIAYSVNPGTAGNQNAFVSLGMDFDVHRPIRITQFGVFDDLTNTLNQPITARLYDRSTQTQVGLPITFTGADGTVKGGHRFLDLATPIVLPAGFQGTMVAEGYGTGSPTERNGNSGGPGNFSQINSGIDLLQFVGSARHGAVGAFPTTLDGGGPARYGAGSFTYYGVEEVPLDPAGAVATGSQGGFSPVYAVDGLPSTPGWAIAGTGGDGTPSQTAMFPTMEPLSAGPGMTLTFTIDQQHAATFHNLGLFRLSATDDPSPSLGSAWTPLVPDEFWGADPGTTFTIRPDDAVLVGGVNPQNTTYWLEVPYENMGGLSQITAFLLEAIDDDTSGLPTGGPGRASNGNFVVTDFRVEARVPEPSTLLLSNLGLLGLAFVSRRRRKR